MKLSKVSVAMVLLVLLTVVCGTYATDPGTDSYMIMHWKLDDPAGWCAFDSLRTCPGVLKGVSASPSVQTQWKPGKYGGALDCNGVSTRALLAGAPCTTVLGNFQEKTITMWVAPRNVSAQQFLFSMRNATVPIPPANVSDPFKFYLLLQNNTAQISFVEGTAISPSLLADPCNIDPDNPTWIHLAVVARNTEDGLAAFDLYVNGVLAVTKTGVARHASGMMYGATVGCHAGDSGTPTSFYNGLIDEVRVYNKALTAQEVMAVKNDVPAVEMFNPSDNLQLYYKFDETSGIYPADSSGNGLDGWARFSTPQWVPGAYGNSLYFDGSMAMIFANRSTDEFAFGGFTSKTLSMWINPESSGPNRMLFSIRPGGTSTYNVYLYQYGNWLYMKVLKWDSTFTFATMTAYYSPDLLVLGTWQHVALITRPTGPKTCEFELYLNGVMEKLQEACQLDAGNRWSGATFGAHAGDTTSCANFFTGSIDDLRVYGTDLSPAQLKAIYEYGPILKGDINQDKAVNMGDVLVLSGDWLANNTSIPGNEYLVENGNFEGYANEAALDAKWQEFPVPGTGSHSTVTLLTSPSDVHSGNKAMRWYYNAHDPNNVVHATDVLYTFNTPVNLSQYDKMSIWLRRHVGNSVEDAIWLKFYTDTPPIVSGTAVIDGRAALTWINGSTGQPGDIWDNWVIDLHGLEYPAAGGGSLSNLTNVTAFTIGCYSPITPLSGGGSGNTGGSGTIDIDDIKLITLPVCSVESWSDLNADCKIDFTDFASLAVDWLKQN